MCDYEKHEAVIRRTRILAPRVGRLHRRRKISLWLSSDMPSRRHLTALLLDFIFLVNRFRRRRKNYVSNRNIENGMNSLVNNMADDKHTVSVTAEK